MTDIITPPRKSDTLREGLSPLYMLGVPGAMLKASRLKKTRPKDQHIMVLPGLGTGDRSTAPLRYFLRKNGYQCVGWGIGINKAGSGLIKSMDDLSERWDVDRTRTALVEGEIPALVDKMIPKILARTEKIGKPITLIGWSLGGVVAREAARELPDHVAHVITMGTPAVGGPKYTSTAGFFKARNVDLDYIEAAIKDRDINPIMQPVTAIYSKTDGIVGWRASIDNISPNADHFEVGGTHLGLGLNAKVWRIILGELRRFAPLSEKTT